MRISENDTIFGMKAVWRTMEDGVKVGVVYDSTCVNPNYVLRCVFGYDDLSRPKTHINILILIESESTTESMQGILESFKKFGVGITNERAYDRLIIYTPLGKKFLEMLGDPEMIKHLDDAENAVCEYISRECKIDISDVYLRETLLTDVGSFKRIYLQYAPDYLKFFEKFA